MSKEEQDLPDGFWRKAFEEADEAPPPRVWDAVERRLDDAPGVAVVPLWGALTASRPVVWGAGLAAAVALLLVGWWLMREVTPTTSVAHQSSTANPVTGEAAASAGVGTTRLAPSLRPIKPEEQDVVGLADRRAESPVSSQGVAALADERSQSPVPSLRNRLTEPSAAVTGRPVPVGPSLARTMPEVARRSTERADSPIRLTASDRLPPRALLNERPTTAVEAPDRTEADQSLAESPIVHLEPISGRPIQFLGSGHSQRIVWFGSANDVPAPSTARPGRARSKREKQFWASVSVTPGSFNPVVSVWSVSQPFVNSYANAYKADPSMSARSSGVNSRASASVSYQASAGVQLTERWSLESGVGYLVGQSTVLSPTRLTSTMRQASFVNRQSEYSVLYTDALRNSITTPVAYPAGVSNELVGDALAANDRSQYLYANYSAQNQQTLANNYQYIQVPVQLGYQLRPRKRLGLALLGGLVTNIFVRNTVGDDLVISTRDGVYRPLSWAATLGARFRYRPSRRWSASLAGLYQPSLGLGTRPESEVLSRPTLSGASFGINYHF